MNQPLINKNILYSFGLQLFLTPLLVGMTFCNIGCLDKTTEREATLGPEVPIEHLDNEIIKSLEGVSITNLKKNDFATYEESLRLESGPTLKTGDLILFVRDLIDEVTYTNIVIDRMFPQKDPTGKEVWITQEEVIPVSKQTLSSWNSTFPLPRFQPQLNELQGVSVHNLRVTKEDFPTPKIENTPCASGDTPACSIPTTLISYDIVFWFENNQRQLTHVESRYSNASSYLAIIISQCQRGRRVFDGKKILIQQCKVLRDYGTRD